RVLAGELAAGAGAAVRRAGQVDAGAVGPGAAALAGAPHRGAVLAVVAARLRPPGLVGDALGRLARRGVGRQRQHLLTAPPVGHFRILTSSGDKPRTRAAASVVDAAGPARQRLRPGPECLAESGLRPAYRRSAKVGRRR